MSPASPFKYRRAVMSFLLILLLFLVMFNVFTVSDQRKAHDKGTRKRIHQQIDLMGAFIREPLLTYDYARVEQFLTRWAEEHDDIVEMKARMPNKFMLVDYLGKKTAVHTIDIEREITYSGISLMNLMLTVDNSEEEEIIRNLQLQLITGSFILTVILGAAIWFSLRKMVFQPLMREVEIRKNAEAMLHASAEQLEENVRMRTAELKNANERLLLEIKERKNAEDALLEREQYLRTIIENEPECVKILAPDGSLVTMNPAGLAMIEADSLEQVAGKSFISLVAPAYREAYRTLHENILEGRKGDLEFELTGLKGARRWLDTRAVPLRNAQSEIVGMLGVSRDITDRKKIDLALQEERDKVQDYLNIAGVIIVAIDAEQKVTLINKKGCEILGYRQEEIIGRNWFENFLPDRERDLVKPLFSKLMAGDVEAVEYHENPVLTKSGGEKLIAWHNSLLRNNQGDIIGTLSSGEDITRRKTEEEKLRISEEKFSKAFRSSPTFITISTLKEGRYLEVNDAFLKASGYSREELIGFTSLELNIWGDPEDRGRLVSWLEDAGSIQNMETRLRMRNGELRTVLYSAELIDIEHERCILAVKLDVSERKMLENQLVHAQKMEAVGQLAGGVAHDFNNVLTAIISNSYLLKNRTREGEQTRELVNKIIALSNNASKIVQELLVFSRKKKGEMSLVHLNDVIKGSGELLKDFIGKDIEIRVKFDSRDLPVMADRHQLEQVIVNLATNARDAMPGGGVVWMETERMDINFSTIKKYPFGRPGSYARLSVSDSGTGMDEVTKEKIFEPFFTTKEVGKGTGLGLAIVYGIIEQHGGFLNVSSEPGRGTTVDMYFPIADTEGEIWVKDRPLQAET